MSENILQKIIDQKKTKIEKLKLEIDINRLLHSINEKDVFFDFKKKIQKSLLLTGPLVEDEKISSSFKESARKFGIKIFNT